ncbi:MAG: hypothetical protein QNJ34_22555 [Xenococcaceae cyanobacterium MO_188.B29]|nr:hypothetical protein [Xenococcaceae cyanobacterium MO_188.B29]
MATKTIPSKYAIACCQTCDNGANIIQFTLQYPTKHYTQILRCRKMEHFDKVVGWIAVGISIAIACFWAFWGIIENFHEGWYYQSLLRNVGLMLLQYLSPVLIFIGVTLVSIYYPRVGGSLHLIIALFLVWFFRASSNAATFFIIVPLVLLGVLYWFGSSQPRKVATYLIVGLPLLTVAIFGAEPIWRVSHRINDGNLAARLVKGNSVKLIWAPDGPGWPRQGASWYEAREVCQYLAEDGKFLASTPQHIWRLPTVDEAVRSMSRHSENSEGRWDSQKAQASYQTRPDKETPLWNVHSQVIYWWTDTEVDEEQTYIIAYDGKVWQRTKRFRLGYLGFRCVKEPSTD